jgi:hypothetical protein
MNKIAAKLMIFLITFSSLIGPQVMAHDGHDHSHPYAWIAHLVWFISIVAIGYIGVLFARSRVETKSRKTES